MIENRIAVVGVVLRGPTDANCSSYGNNNEKEEARPMTRIVGVSASSYQSTGQIIVLKYSNSNTPRTDIKIVIAVNRNP